MTTGTDEVGGCGKAGLQFNYERVAVYIIRYYSGIGYINKVRFLLTVFRNKNKKNSC